MNKIYLTQKEFDALLTYNCTWPTGPREGFEFKRNIITIKENNKTFYCNRHNLPQNANIIGDDWFYYKYSKDLKNPGQLIAAPQEIVIVKGDLQIDKTIARFMERGE